MKSRNIRVTQINTVEEAFDDFNERIENEHDVILKNHYSHISAGTELACLEGLESFFSIPGIPGYTAIAEVVEKGKAITGIEKGDLVYTYGPHAEYFKIDNTERWHGVCVKLPEGINPEHAAFTHMAGIAMTAIRKSSIEIGDYVAVTGLGAIGNLAAQLAQLQGATVIATDVDEKRCCIARESGIEHVLNSSWVNPMEYIRELTSGKGVEVLIDASGISPVIEESIKWVKTFGDVILLGSPRAAYQSNLTGFLRDIHILPPSVTVRGSLEFIYPTHETEFVKHSIERNARIILKLIKDGKLKISPVYSHKIKPAEAQDAYNGLSHEKDKYIGVVVDWLND